MCPTNPITYAEASSIIHSLRYIPLYDFGTAAWKSQREWFELLNIASHYNTCEVQRGKMADDFVTALFIEHGKISVLIHEIIVVDTFRRKILPLVRDDLCATATGSYMYIQYEGILMNLIECLLFHEDVVLAMDEDACEFVEYCWKNVAEILNQTEQMHDFVMESHGSGSRSQTLSENSSSDSFIAQQQKLRFNIAMSSLSCLWFIIEKVHRLPLSVLNCILLKIDLPCGLAHVIEAQPWKVRIGGKELKYRDYEFFPITNPEDAHLLVPVEAHTWFLLHFLLCDAECRKKYCYTIHRKDTMTRVRRFLHDMILDQIPALTDVARALDEMSFLELPTHAQEKFKTSLVVEPVPRIITAATAGFQHNEDYRAFSKRFTLLIKDPETILQDAVRMSKWFDFH